MRICFLQAVLSIAFGRRGAMLFALFLAGGGFLGLSQTVQGQDLAYHDTDVLRELRQLQAEVEHLKARQGRLERLPAVTCDEGPPAHCESILDCTSWGGGGAGAGSKFPTVRLTGFFQADAAWFSQDAGNIAAVGDVQDGADFRRARLAAVGQTADNVGYMLEMDFAFPGRPSFMDVWMEIQETLGPGNLRIGQYRQPFGMDGLNSVKDLTFLERALPFAFLPFRQIGAMYHGHAANQRATYAISGFRFPTGPFGGNIGDDGGYGAVTWLTGLLVDNGDGCSVLHVGGAYSYIDPANDQVQYRNQPEIFVGESGGAVPPNVPANVPVFVDTGAIATSHVNLANVELGYAVGSFHAQSEMFVTQVSRLGDTAVTFTGAYAQVGYILTGESLPYNRKAGVFGHISPRSPVTKCGGCGAWEIAARWSTIDLNDASVHGGSLTDTTLGLNWYLNNNTKFQLNYIHAFLHNSSNVVNPVVYGSDADIVAFRGQVDF